MQWQKAYNDFICCACVILRSDHVLESAWLAESVQWTEPAGSLLTLSVLFRDLCWYRNLVSATLCGNLC